MTTSHDMINMRVKERHSSGPRSNGPCYSRGMGQSMSEEHHNDVLNLRLRHSTITHTLPPGEI